MSKVPKSGYMGSKLWNRRFHPLDTSVPPNGYNGSTMRNRRFQALENCGTFIDLIINKI